MAVPVASLPDTGDTPFVFGIRAHIPLNKGVGVPPGYQLLKGADGAYLKGADGAYLYGVAV